MVCLMTGITPAMAFAGAMALRDGQASDAANGETNTWYKYHGAMT
jgi:hypothetical protein